MAQASTSSCFKQRLSDNRRSFQIILKAALGGNSCFCHKNEKPNFSGFWTMDRKSEMSDFLEETNQIAANDPSVQCLI